MTWWRTFVRFLAREDLALLEAQRQELANAVYRISADAERLELASFAHGEMVGRQRMADAVLEAVSQRMGGADDLATEDDVERAKRGLLH